MYTYIRKNSYFPKGSNGSFVLNIYFKAILQITYWCKTKGVGIKKKKRNVANLFVANSIQMSHVLLAKQKNPGSYYKALQDKVLPVEWLIGWKYPIFVLRNVFFFHWEIYLGYGHLKTDSLIFHLHIKFSPSLESRMLLFVFNNFV